MRSRRACIAGVLTVLAATLTNCVRPSVPISPEVHRIGPAETRFATPVLDLPFRSVRGIPLLLVRINGQGPFRVLLDTGAEVGAVLDPRVVRTLGLPDKGSITVRGAAGETKTGVRVRHVQSLVLGDGEFRDVRVWELDLSELERIAGTRFDGLLGLPLFSDCLLTINYPDRRVRIERGALPDPDGRETLPLDPERATPVVRFTFGSVRIAALIDSGGIFDFQIPPDVVQGLAFSHGPVDGYLTRTFFATHRRRMGRLSGDVVLGQHVFERPIVDVSGDDRARMGAQALAPFTVTFDRRRHAVRFTRVTTDPILTPSLRGLGISTESGSGGPLIDDIVPGTPAAALDIQRGDRILTVDGQAIEKLSNAEVRRMMDERNELVLVLRRGDQQVEVRVPVIDLVP